MTEKFSKTGQITNNKPEQSIKNMKLKPRKRIGI